MSEISGVLKNALERGWQLNEVRQSLLNSGYPLQEVDGEITIFNQQAQTDIYNQQQKPQIQELKSFQIPLIRTSIGRKTAIITLVCLIILTIAGTALTWFFLK